MRKRTMYIFGRFILFGMIWSALGIAGPPQIWFAPLDDVSRQVNIFKGIIPSSDSGPTDYMDLFAPDAPWPAAASHVSVFKLYAGPITGITVPGFSGGFSDSQLQQIFSFLKQHNIAVALEFGPLTAADGCGTQMTDGQLNGVEGFAGTAVQAIVDKVQANGGTLDYLSMDEPFFYGNIYSGAGACNWSAQQIATNAIASLNILRGAFPNIVIGDIEPVPGGGASDWLQRYAAWMDAFQAVTGSALAFFDFDVNRSYPAWVSDIVALRAETSQRAIPFGIIYDDLQNDSSDEEWITHAEDFFTEYELSNGPPDLAIFQSWTAYPMQVLPETTPYTFTWLIDQYVRPRPTLSLSIASSQATGTLLDNSGNAISSAPIDLTMQPTSGPGIVTTYTLTGTVPTTVSAAVIQICVNMCGTQGTNNMNVYSFQYADSGKHAHFDFSQGLSGGWGVNPNGTANLQTGTDSNGSYLSVSATPTQATYINAPSVFAVTPGSAYTLTIQAKISPDSIGSGYFAQIFMNGTCVSLCPLTSAFTEVSRDTLAFAPGTMTLGTPVTNNDGSYSLPFSPPDAEGTFQVTAYYAGTGALWPAQATAVLAEAPTISPNGVVNAADFKSEPLSPGAWFTIYGENLGTAADWTSADTLTLGGAAVSVCGIPAVLSFNSGPIIANGTASWQLYVLMPDGVAGQTSCPIIVTVNGLMTQTVTAIKSGIMELFTFSSSGGQLPIVTHADYSLVGPSSAGFRPAAPGETLMAWGTGDCTLPSVTVANIAAPVSFSGRVAPGLCQVNFSVPQNLSGSNSLEISTALNSYVLYVAP